MDKPKKQLAILNLTGELLPELGGYFISRQIKIVDPLASNEEMVWTHIITKDVNDFDLIARTYDVKEHEINIISLSKLNDLQNFTINNGNIVLDDCWFKGPMGAFILDKYFQGFGGISLGDNYPAFKEIGSFNITNPFNTGEYLDRLIQKAFENGTEALALKTYFDHLVMYISGLKKKGKAGLPFEVTYGAFEDVFAIQIHFFSKKLNVMDVAASLNSTLSKRAEEYLLNVAIQSADFFDFSYMPEVNKTVITGLWTKDPRIQFENRGFMFTSLVGGVALTQYQTDSTVSAMIVAGEEIKDFSEKIVIPNKLPMEASTGVSVRGSEEEDDSETLVKGLEEDDEFSALIKGLDEESADEPTLVKGGSILDEIAQTVKGKTDEDKNSIRISGNKLDVDKFAFKVATSVDETTKEKNLRVRSLGDKLPQSIKTGLFDFAKNLNKEVENLDDYDLDVFQLEKVPEIIQEELRLQMLNNTPVSEKNNSMSLKSLEQGMSGAFDSKSSNEDVRQLQAKLNTANAESEQLKSQVKALNSEVRILKDTRNKLAEIQIKAARETSDLPFINNDEDEKLRKQFQQKLTEQKALNEQDYKKLNEFLEREAKLIANLKQEEMKSRKLQLEVVQKESMFSQELEKSSREAKAKELMLIKGKEAFAKMMGRKEQEVSDYKMRVDQLAKTVNSGDVAAQAHTIRALEKQNQNLQKQLDVYKTKISSLASNINISKSDDSSKEEVRKLQMQNQQMKNQVETSKRELEKLHAKSVAESAQVTSLKIEKFKLEQALKKASLENKEVKEDKVSAQVSHQPDPEVKRLQLQNQVLETQVKDSNQKISSLESKLADVVKSAQKVVSGGEEGSKVKVNQLEGSLKKLTQDLVESRNQLAESKKDANKLRQEKISLQNQLDKLKKDTDKGKPASPKKPGGKVA